MGTRGNPEIDTHALVKPYYDEGGTHERDATSLAIYDAPGVPVSVRTPKIVSTATDYLILRGTVLYTLTWTQTTQFVAVGKPPTVS